MYTAGMNQILRDEGFSGVFLYYSSVPFDSIGALIPPLPPEQRYNPLWLRGQAGEPPVVVIPAVSPGDLVNYTSFEKWLLDLRRLQTSGQVKSDLVLHLNMDADADTWLLPLHLPKIAAWFPNTGGLMEYIRAVNKNGWAEFTLPGEYLQTHLPKGELLVRQDLADGGFDGNYSWAEKFASLGNWTLLEKSRLASYRANALGKRLPDEQSSAIQSRLWEGTSSAFFQRWSV